MVRAPYRVILCCNGEHQDEFTELSIPVQCSHCVAELTRETATRRERPPLVLGNIAGEIAVLGEERARHARYENDSTVFDPADTVCNVVDESFGVFYPGAAD